ncbi:MAG: HNH endonuclease [Anaerolineae bacterium]|nr:HNH endonuclease [Anaerolineae bacterium]MCO5187545.1 HNH endonuclease [Anaerolineae bacterium]MCO5193357.1 HNH endonuclease [Anaerolineae bacterium]MCO5198832.1 HNH endonuclease [Anaerolineae bacterium]MCO5203916.1 HNH endonuclease [Anaerolineae bacterium]
MAVLLLNASYEPLSVIPIRRAISLLLRERVDAATDEAITLNGTSQSIKIPRVLRLRRYVHVPQRRAQWSRLNVLKRDKYTCIYCEVAPGAVQRGRQLTVRDFTVDHILPKSRGGHNTWSNTACACYACNHRKGARMPHEAGMKLAWEPKTPRVTYFVLGGDIPEAWKIYLEVPEIMSSRAAA